MKSERRQLPAHPRASCYTDAMEDDRDDGAEGGLSNEELDALEALCEARLARIRHSDDTVPVAEDHDDGD
jgi:hypothetical protein